MTEVTFPGVDGDLAGVLFEPAGSAEAHAAVLVPPEIDGFCEGTVAAARRLASAG
jgi:dienelactone hydrolase